jgi:DNA end-binding protein Ku
LDLLRYAHELRSPSEVEAPPVSAKGASVSERELKMAEQLIAGMTGKWDPARYKDEYRADVLALVRRKVRAGQTHMIVEPEEAEARRPARSEVVDLMPLLKRSLDERGRAARRGPSAKRGGTSPRRHRRSA